MTFERSAGILLHPTSLPGRFGIGDLGPEAYKFVEFLEAAGQTLWQVCPLGPTGYGDSPYQCFSAFAGNPLLISPEILKIKGLLHNDELIEPQVSNPLSIDFGSIIPYKFNLLRIAYKNFEKKADSEKVLFEKFCKKHSFWLEDFSLFMAIKNYFGGALWTSWDADIALRKKSALKYWREKLADEIRFHKFIQFEFFNQWLELRKFANSKNIKIIGDLPIFIAYDSADLWANKELFTVDENGKLIWVAGVPPDYFSPTGQLWGNPLYKWDVMEKDDFKWWVHRFRSLLELVDIIRIDHFRGFEAYWQIPGDAPTAETGKWVKAPGKKFFSSILRQLGDIPILAEDLGVITKQVEELRDRFNFPGMKILQFAFGTGMEKKFLPHNYVKNCVVYTGSHDNDTTRGYFEKVKHENNDIYSFTRNYLNYWGDDLVLQLIRLAYSSVANLVIIPMQDVLNLGSEARMNFPGRLGGNWTWRFSWNQVDENLAPLYKSMTILYERPALVKKN